MEEFEKISLTDWVKSGEGGNAISYYNSKNDNIMLKLSKNSAIAKESMNDEINCIDNALKLNIRTPKMIKKVICNDRYGMIYEKIHSKKSLGRLCHDEPENIKFFGKEFARETVILHSTKCDIPGMRNYKEYYLNLYKTKKQDKILTPKLIDLINSEIEERNTCIHGDLTVGNIIFADNKWYWIDLGRIGYGDPVFDLMTTYFSFNILSQFRFVRDIFHMSKEQLKELWDSFIEEYARLTNQDLSKLLKRIEKLTILFYFKIWVTGRNIPIITNIVHHNIREYYKKIMA